MEYGLIGAKLGHSYSVPIHAQLGQYDYRLMEMDKAGFIDLLRHRAFKGANVTIPYKRLAYEMCDELSDTARDVGSVNTLLVRSDGSLYGHNTDIGGFIALARHAKVNIADKKAVILGSGGTSLTARAACRKLGAREIVVVSRSGPVDYDALYRFHADAEVLINTTPVGMYPDSGMCPADIGRLERLEGVLDVIYNPDRTALIMAAQARGIPSEGGLYMLVDQAREAAELFGGAAIPESETDRIFRQLKAKALNLILIGMPGCGKSTLGRALSRQMDRPFLDTDAAIEEEAGQSIPEIFSSRGESAFRELEHQAIERIGREKGQVIATGGGAVLREDNLRALRQNGILVLITRPLDALPMDGRPLSRSPQALAAMWEARKSAYLGAADFTVNNIAAVDVVAAQIQEAFYEAAGR
ncbi:MAG: hypothetical protein IJH38_02555 [Clostridia bacterium]|nr:hypothetical protein [Clostridia bacterium]